MFCDRITNIYRYVTNIYKLPKFNYSICYRLFGQLWKLVMYVNKINNSFHFFNRVILTFCNKLNALSVAKSQKTTKLLNAAAICYNHIK